MKKMFIFKNSNLKRLVLASLFIGCTIQAQGQTQEPCVTTWDTQLGDPGSTTIVLPISGGIYDVDVDNDGIFLLPNQTGTIEIDFGPGNAGIKTIAIRPSVVNINNQLRINHKARGSTPQKLISIVKWGDIVWTSMSNAFRDCSNMTIADDAGVPSLTEVEDMRFIFSGATIFNGDLSGWNVSNVTDMSFAFREATIFNSDLSGWNVSTVTDMRFAFRGATNFTSDLSSWNVSKVTDMSGAFREATNFNSDLSSWDVSKVERMRSMFNGASLFNPNKGLNDWNVSNVTTMQNMFKSTTNFNSDLSSWNVSNVTDMTEMLTGATGFSTENYDALLIGWSNLSSLQDGVVFGAPPTTYCSGEAGRDILTGTHNWDISGDTLNCPVAPFVTTWNTELGMGQSGDTTIKLPISGGAYDVDTSYDGTTFNADMPNQTGTIEIDFGVGNAGVHTIAVRPNAANTNNQLRIDHSITGSTPQKLVSIKKWGDIVWASMENAFRGCSNMTIKDDAGVPDLSEVTNMDNMFRGAKNLTGSLKDWNVSNITSMAEMFLNAEGFNGSLNDWDVSNVTNMNGAFTGAASFTGNDSAGGISIWNVSQVTDMSNMFSGAEGFNGSLKDWNISNVSSMANMFTNATSFSSENYDALLTSWSELTPQNDVVFGAPPTTYCAGKAGRDILTGTHNWTISGDRGLGCSDLALSIDAFLQGPYDTNRMMNASLLTANNGANIIPTETPYGDGATIEDTVLGVIGDDAIVDWVEVSLHNPIDANIVISTTSALIQRDGNVVALDGSSGLQIQGIAGDYKVSINHRNHIPVITDAAQSLSATETPIDFTNNLIIVTGGSNAMADVETDVYALFSGDVDGDGQVQSDDYNAVLQDIGKGGYLTSDINMNGEIQVDDRDLVFRTFGKGKQF